MFSWRSKEKKLREAAWNGDADTVRKLLATRKVDVDGVDEHKCTALHRAAQFGHVPVVELLLEAGAPVHAVNEVGSTPLHSAARSGHPRVIELLLKAGATVDSEENESRWTALHDAALHGHAHVVELLLKAGANVDADERDGSTALHDAAGNGHAGVVELLLEAGATVNAVKKDGSTALHKAALQGIRCAPVVELLLKAGAAVNAVDEKKWTALRHAAVSGYPPVVELLLEAGASVDAPDKHGRTPLSAACEFHKPDTTRALLNANANAHAKDNDGLAPLHQLLEIRHGGLRTEVLRTLQVLVKFGVTWDAQCDQLRAAEQAWEEAPALRLCMALWAQEHADGRELSGIPIETVKRGVESTQTFIESLKRSSQIVLRRKICLVGLSCAGKTSFVKSITASEPQLEHVDNRTIGIDHVPLQFEQQASGQGKPKTHVVTFWDFAGQDAYQVAHSLFFSPRTLYFVFVDLEAFTIAYKQAVIFADDDSQEPKLLDEFFERSVRQWTRLIVARHPEAELVFLATKEDMLQENAYLQRVLKQELQRRLQGILAEVQAMKAAAEGGPVPSVQDSRGHVTPTIVYVSCSSSASVRAARAQIETIIINSNYSFPMTDEYSNVLNTILNIRNEAREDGICGRITRTFAPVIPLLTELAALQIDSDLCSSILQILHDLGDVLWYEKLDIHRFRDTIILDPLLLIEFIRQVVTHEHAGVKMSHAKLKAKPFWRNLGDDKELMKDMKQLMQSFHLVYSAAEDHVMDWDSHLIVPAYWKTREPATRRFPSGGLLATMDGSSESDLPPRNRVRWDYHFECGLPATLFDHFVVACVSPSFKFDAGPDWLLHCERSGATACRVMISRDTLSLHRTIHCEAVVAVAATPVHESDLWNAFQRMVRALTVVLREHKGLNVSCYAWDDDGEDHNLKTLLRSKDARELRTWMPPVATWSSLRL